MKLICVDRPIAFDIPLPQGLKNRIESFENAHHLTYRPRCANRTPECARALQIFFSQDGPARRNTAFPGCQTGFGPAKLPIWFLFVPFPSFFLPICSRFVPKMYRC
jgi:hypothetical protein